MQGCCTELATVGDQLSLLVSIRAVQGALSTRTSSSAPEGTFTVQLAATKIDQASTTCLTVRLYLGKRTIAVRQSAYGEKDKKALPEGILQDLP